MRLRVGIHQSEGASGGTSLASYRCDRFVKLLLLFSFTPKPLLSVLQLAQKETVPKTHFRLKRRRRPRASFTHRSWRVTLERQSRARHPPHALRHELVFKCRFSKAAHTHLSFHPGSRLRPAENAKIKAFNLRISSFFSFCQHHLQICTRTSMNTDRSSLHLDGIPADKLMKLLECLEPFRLSLEKLQEVSSRLRKDMIRGLKKHSHHNAPVKMLPTFVRATPDGTEKGDFLALDLGGTNFRVLHVRVVEEEQKVLKMDSQICAIPTEMMLGPGEQLFDHIAACLSDFISSRNLRGQTLPLGFTFSFPCEQKEIDKSILIRWTKGFKCSGVEGEDVVRLLKEAIRRRGDYEIGTVAMVNDTVGTMMSCGYRDQSCEIGMIIGTGTNACYMEEMKNVKRVEGEDGRMCINTEWGGFGDDGSLKDIQTPFDVTVDEKSVNPGVHIFEKMISGMYLGEIVRLLLVKLTEDKLLFNGRASKLLLTPGSFHTKFISEIEEEEHSLENAQAILSRLGLKWDEVDARVVRVCCDTISSRSARLCAAALATIASRIRTNRKMDQLKTTVGVDGTVYKKHPNFSDELQATVRLLAPACHINFLVSEDGSGKGAAMVTAVAQRLASQSRLLEESEGEDEEEEEEEENN